MSEWLSLGKRVLLGFLLLELLLFFWQWQQLGDDRKNTIAVPDAPVAVKAVDVRAAVEGVLKRNLWKSKVDTAAKPTVESKVSSSLPVQVWRLYGLTKRGEDLTALIGLEGKPKSLKVYRQGEYLSDGVVLLKVFGDSAVLLDGEQQKTIYLFGRE